jgi:hypothetical protein
MLRYIQSIVPRPVCGREEICELNQSNKCLEKSPFLIWSRVNPWNSEKPPKLSLEKLGIGTTNIWSRLRLGARTGGRALLVIALATLSPAFADPVPSFWDPALHLERPDISALRAIRFLTDDDYPPLNFARPARSCKSAARSRLATGIR